MRAWLAPVALALGGACALLGWFDPSRFFAAYLTGVLMWIGVPLGALALVMTHALTGGAWGLAVRGTLEPAVRTLAWWPLLLLPLFAGLPHLYPWARPAEVARDAILAHRAVWMNPALVVQRTAAFLVLWWLTGRLMRTRARSAVAGPGLVLLLFSVTLFAVDWGMSLDTRFASGAYGLIMALSQVLAALALSVLVLAREGPGPAPGDLGNLLLGFLMMFAYVAYAQFLVVWSGNLPAEVAYYAPRTAGGWRAYVAILFVAQFACPFGMLLAPTLKGRIERLARPAALILAARFFYTYWLVMPAFTPGLAPHLLDLAAPGFVGAAWLWTFARARAAWREEARA